LFKCGLILNTGSLFDENMKFGKNLLNLSLNLDPVLDPDLHSLKRLDPDKNNERGFETLARATSFDSGSNGSDPYVQAMEKNMDCCV
jgi:hypothetical protein